MSDVKAYQPSEPTVTINIPPGIERGMKDDLEAALIHMNKKRRSRGMKRTVPYKILQQPAESI